MDETGEPLEGISMLAEAPDPSRVGWRDWGRAQTDDRGEFHIAVAPGKYVLKAAPDSGDPDTPLEIRSDGTSEGAYRTVYYPDAPDKTRATVLEVAADRAGLDFRLARAPALGITGTVAGVPPGCQPELTLQVGYRDGEVEHDEKLKSGPQGKFEIPHLEPGKYRVYASCDVGGHTMRSQMLEISLENAVAMADLTLGPGREVIGTVEPAGIGGRTVRLESAASTRGWGPSRTGRVAADGTFQIAGIQPDRYRVLLLPQKSDEYIEVKLDDAATAHRTVDLRNGGSKLKIAVRQGGSIAGKVETRSTAMVLVFPDGDSSLDAIQFRPVGSDGAFRFEGLAPGKYRLYAYDPLQGRKMELKDAVAAAEIVEVRAGETTARNANLSGREGGDAKR